MGRYVAATTIHDASHFNFLKGLTHGIQVVEQKRIVHVYRLTVLFLQGRGVT